MNGDQYSFMSGADSDNEERESNHEGLDIDTDKDNIPNSIIPNQAPLMSPPPLYTTDDYKIDGM